MNNVKIYNITPKTFDNLFDPCRSCLYWEAPHLTGKISDSKANLLKKDWFCTILNKWGPCGKILYVDNEPVGFVQFAPNKFFQNLKGYPVKPSDDAVFISCLYVKEGYRQKKYGVMLLNAVIRELKERNIKAVETIARKRSIDNPSGPIEFYLENGFSIVKDHEEYPVVRRELT